MAPVCSERLNRAHRVGREGALVDLREPCRCSVWGIISYLRDRFLPLRCEPPEPALITHSEVLALFSHKKG